MVFQAPSRYRGNHAIANPAKGNADIADVAAGGPSESVRAAALFADPRCVMQ